MKPMRSLLFHCKNYETTILKLANRPKNITPEKVNHTTKKCKNCIVILITVEKDDESIKIIPQLTKDIISMSKEIKRNNIVILPFAHLSNNLATTKDGIKFLNELEIALKDKIIVDRDHFGSHKELLLSLYGHPGNARYREYY